MSLNKRIYLCNKCQYECELLMHVAGEVPKICPFHIVVIPDWKRKHE